MTQEQKIELIALYDGWEKTGYSVAENKRLFRKSCSDSFGFDNERLETMKYLTDLNWLHPVAMKVLDELSEISDIVALSLHRQIFYNCASKPKDGQYIDLFEAVVCAIQFINEQKQTENA
jgi:hypothetical protein